MSLEWETYTIGEACDLLTGFPFKSKYYLNEGNYKVVRGDNVKTGFIKWDEKTRCWDELNDNLKKYLLKKEDIVLSMDGNVGQNRAVISEKDLPALLAQRVACIRSNYQFDQNFIRYLIFSNRFKKYIDSIKTGTTINHISLKQISEFEFKAPDILIQKKIGNILREIDDKIVINQQINHNLEKISSRLYSNLIYDEKDLEFIELKEICKFIKGRKPTEISEQYKSDFEDYLTIEVLSNQNQVYAFDDKGIKAKEKDILMVMDGASSGKLFYGKKGLVGSTLAKIDVKEDYIELVYQFLKINEKYITENTTGSAIPHTDKGLVLSLRLPISEKLTEYSDKFKNIRLAIISNNNEIMKLQHLRDILLPKLMSGEIDVSEVNCDLKLLIKKFIFKIIKYYGGFNMKTKLISKIQNQMKPFLNQGQYLKLTNSLLTSLKDIEIINNNNESNEKDNFKLLKSFLSAKQVEGRSEKTLIYYNSTLEKMLSKINKQVYNITTDDIRRYLFDYKKEKNSSKITIDNMRRIFSSFFSWLEDEDYILKNPVRRIHRVKTGRVVKEVLTDENLEILRDNCDEIRDLAIVEILISTGIRVGELVRLNIRDINFFERECVVFGKGESERVVYFDARTKIHLLEYIESRSDDNPALFVSLNKPYERLGISGVETRLRELGRKCKIPKVHPHKFRRTLATNAIDKGMPIEQLQKLLGHVQIDTTMQYAMVNQSNVKIAHRKFIS